MTQSEYIENNIETHGRCGVYIFTAIGTEVSRSIGSDIYPAGTIVKVGQDKKGYYMILDTEEGIKKVRGDSDGRFYGYYIGSFTYHDPHF